MKVHVSHNRLEFLSENLGNASEENEIGLLGHKRETIPEIVQYYDDGCLLIVELKKATSYRKKVMQDKLINTLWPHTNNLTIL